MTTQTKTKRYVFTVTGSGEFPKDMLEYDQATALTPADQKVIDATYEDADDNVLWNPDTQHLRLNTVQLMVCPDQDAMAKLHLEGHRWPPSQGLNHVCWLD
jgi:hypothetical protein